MISLSEAIRIGSRISPQVSGTFDDGQGGTCALGAAGWAAGLSGSGINMARLSKVWPIIDMLVIHPVLNQPCPLRATVMNLNDQHHWSRDEIAGWVATVEMAVENQRKEVAYGLAQ